VEANSENRVKHFFFVRREQRKEDMSNDKRGNYIITPPWVRGSVTSGGGLEIQVRAPRK